MKIKLEEEKPINSRIIDTSVSPAVQEQINKEQEKHRQQENKIDDFSYIPELEELKRKEQEYIDKENFENETKTKKSIIKKKTKENKKKLENVNPVSNEDYFENYKRNVRANRFKRIAIISSILISLLVIIIMNLYFIFIREVTPVSEIAQEVKVINKINTFPVEDVQGYLENYAEDIIFQNIEYSNGTGSKVASVSNIKITRISVKSDVNANVYFTCKINTNVGSAEHNFLLPLYYNNLEGFKLSGDLIVCASQDQSSTDKIEGSLWDFGKIKKYSEEDTTECYNLINNFLEILYNNPDHDISTFYSGKDKLGDPNFTFISLNEVSYYQESNSMGLNCEISYVVKSTEGLTYTIKNYLLIKKQGEKLIIAKFY